MPIDPALLAARLAQLPDAAAWQLHGILTGAAFGGVITAADATALAQHMRIPLEQLPLALVPFAQLYAIAPISNFQVGAVARGLSGPLYFGANLEVAGQALNFSVHAEQSATANAWSHGEEGLDALGISAAPCGYCRQFLYETATAQQLTLTVPSAGPRHLAHYLPDAFGPQDLGIEGGLLRPQNHGLALLHVTPSATAQAALAAANASYAPYTGTFSGIALRLHDGAIFTGRLAENAAYNPSLSPIAGALSRLALYNRRFEEIAEAVLVEAAGSASQAGVSRAMLGSVSDVPLTLLAAVPG